MKLSEFLETKELTPQAFAGLLPVSGEAVRLWLNGDRTPRPAQMQRIMEITEGAVTPNDFLPPFREAESAPIAPPPREAPASEDVTGEAAA